MKIVKLFYCLYKMRVLSPMGLYRLLEVISKYGINVMALLAFAQKTDAEKIAVVDENETISYDQLLSQSEKLAMILKENYQLKKGQKVGFLCRNHASLVKAIFAVSLLGADLYLLNIEMSRSQFNNLLGRNALDLLVYDFELSSLVEQSEYRKDRIFSYHETLPAISNLHKTGSHEKQKLQRTSASKIVILTSGTTGDFKVAAHKPSIFNFLNPVLAFLSKLNVLNYHTAYIATPIYHGYGIAVLFLFISMGKKIVIQTGFDAKKACRLIGKHQVEVVTVVPLMLDRMLSNNAEDLTSLACIASGGAELNPKLVEQTFLKLGDILYNLYGTSEAGLNIIATPQDLKYSPKTIGKTIKGVRLKIVDGHQNEVEIGKVGQFCIKNSWSMGNRSKSWIETGDLGYQDPKGYYFLCGRADDMVVSAGENVYPIEIEQVLIKHPQVEDVAVIGIKDENFGQRLKAFVVLGNNANLTKEELFQWLRPRVARFQLPKEISIIDQMPYTPLGKHDKKQLN